MITLGLFYNSGKSDSWTRLSLRSNNDVNYWMLEIGNSIEHIDKWKKKNGWNKYENQITEDELAMLILTHAN